MTIYLLYEIPHNIHYLNRYVSFIEHCKIKNATLTKKSKHNPNGVYVENHHILPKSMFPEYAIFSKNSWNKIVLTGQQHFIAHWILWKAYNNSEMTFAFWKMAHKKNTRINSKVYQALKEEYQLLMSTLHTDTISVKHVDTNDRKRISRSEFESSDNVNWVGVTKGLSYGKDKILAFNINTKEYARIPIELFHTSDEWIGSTAGKTLKLTAVIREAKRNRIVGTITVKNIHTGESKRISTQEFYADNNRNWISHHKGVAKTEEHKLKGSIAKLGELNPMFGKPSPKRGKICYTDGISNYYFSENERVPENYRLGMTYPKNRKSSKRKSN